MITDPYPEVTIDAPQWMRCAYLKVTGKTIDERYKEKMEQLMVEIIQKQLKID